MPLPQNRLVLASDRDHFERQPDEPDKAWRAFILYRDLGLERSHKKVADQLRPSTGPETKLSSIERKVEYWASRWAWTTRVRSWDMEIDRHRRRDLLKEVQKMRSRHVQLAKSLQGLGATELRKWLDFAKEATDQRILTIREILFAIESGAKLEKTSLGEPETIVEHQHQVQKDDQRAAMKRLLGDEEALEALDLILKKASNGSVEEPTA